MQIEQTNFNNLVTQIENTHQTLQSQAIKSVSSTLTIRNWIIGYYIVEYEQNGEDRAKYGARVIENLVKRLNHIRGMSKSNLKLFRQFYFVYPQINQIASTQFKLTNQKSQSLTDQFKNSKIEVKKLLNSCSFTHLIELIKLDDPLKRLFYEVETIKGNWSVRELKRQINSATYERIGLSKSKKELIDSIQIGSEQLLPQQIIKDP